jgi:hypothetical protein
MWMRNKLEYNNGNCLVIKLHSLRFQVFFGLYDLLLQLLCRFLALVKRQRSVQNCRHCINLWGQMRVNFSIHLIQ